MSSETLAVLAVSDASASCICDGSMTAVKLAASAAIWSECKSACVLLGTTRFSSDSRNRMVRRVFFIGAVPLVENEKAWGDSVAPRLPFLGQLLDLLSYLMR